MHLLQRNPREMMMSNQKIMVLKLVFYMYMALSMNISRHSVKLKGLQLTSCLCYTAFVIDVSKQLLIHRFAWRMSVIVFQRVLKVPI